MCGIVCVMRSDGKPASRRVLKRYYKQKDRGEDGFGFVALDTTGTVSHFERYQEEKETRDSLETNESKRILFHHRYPTSTANVPEAAHPILVKHKELKHSYYVVHNGVISNPTVLKVDHEQLGYKYTTEIQTQYAASNGSLYYGDTKFNDSEALAIELARTIEGLQPTVRATGSIACIVWQANKAGTKVKAMYYGTNGGNPLTITEDEHGLVIASEGGMAIPSGIMYRYDMATEERSIANVPLMAYAPIVYNKPYASTYGYTTKHGDFKFQPDAEENDYDPDLDIDVWGDEASLEEMREQYRDIEADIEIAKQAGELEELEDLRIELQAVREDILDYLERTGQPTRRIGF